MEREEPNSFSPQINKVNTMVVRKSKGLDPTEHNYLVLVPRGWGEAETLDRAIEQAREQLPNQIADERDEVEAWVYLITPDTNASISDTTGRVVLDNRRLDHCPPPDPGYDSEMRDIDGKEVEVRDEDERLEFLTNFLIRVEA